MQLPDAETLRAILAAAKEHGVSHLRVGSLEVRFAPPPPAPAVPIAEALLAGINQAAPLQVDPIEHIRTAAANGGRSPINLRSAEDALQVLAAGGQLTSLVPGNPGEGPL